MKILITGAAGFIGTKLAKEILKQGNIQFEGEPARPISQLTLFDVVPTAIPNDPRLKIITGEISNAESIAAASKDADAIWHLAAVVSAEAEMNFDLGMQVNLHGLLTLLKTARASGKKPRFVNASSFAVFGGALPEIVTDETSLTPTTSYGAQKAIGELLVADYSRKGFIDGRSVRLPTITVRPGKPNKAASTFVSSIIREPLARQSAVCPVAPDALVYISSPRRAVEAMLHAMSLSPRTLGAERTIPLPGLTLSVAEMVATLEKVAGPEAAQFIRWQPDALIQKIVAGWPTHVNAARASNLGLRADNNFEEIVRAHIEDESVTQWWRS